MIGCRCAVCTSPDPKNRRTRPSIVVSVPNGDGGDGAGRNLLVDTTPEMRLQMLASDIRRVEGVLVTHTHADHIFGMDDIRQINFRYDILMPVYGTTDTLDRLASVFDYCFKETQTGGGKPKLALFPFEPYRPFDLCGVTVTPLTVFHGNLPVIAFKFGQRFAYVTDVSRIPDETRAHLRGLDSLVIGTVRYEPHPTHFGLYQALDEMADLAPRQGYFTHLSHHFDHATVEAELPPNIRLAYDGLQLKVPAGAHP
jgi:phosphoribosyl 1,2-cyclic phosphate phosphodiesterase